MNVLNFRYRRIHIVQYSNRALNERPFAFLCTVNTVSHLVSSPVRMIYCQLVLAIQGGKQSLLSDDQETAQVKMATLHSGQSSEKKHIKDPHTFSETHLITPYIYSNNQNEL